MIKMFVNLKRFDIPMEMGGICPEKEPVGWATRLLEKLAEIQKGSDPKIQKTQICLFLPEALIPAAVAQLKKHRTELTNLSIGSQGLFRDDVSPGGNFGAFTTNLTASAAANLGVSWAIVGHSEERSDKEQIIREYGPEAGKPGDAMKRCGAAVNRLLNRAIHCGLKKNLNILYCVGETAGERGSGTLKEQQRNIRTILEDQLSIGLADCREYVEKGCEIAVAYEPRWAIGPGKTPPGPDYIAMVTSMIKDICGKKVGYNPQVLYGGGLKRENAETIGRVGDLDGGLIALTKFTPPVAFDPGEFTIITNLFIQGTYNEI